MILCEAIIEVANGHIVISNADKRYTPEQLAPKWYGKHYASFNSAGMTEKEVKGEWRIEALGSR
jgi:hypothetical protein